MKRSTCLLLLAAALAACSPPRPFADAGDSATTSDAPAGPCGTPDRDQDSIPDESEGVADTDNDGLPNAQDPDADGDGISDRVEAQRPASRDECVRTPVDSDNDRTPDFLDTDSNEDGVPDGTQVVPSPMQPRADTPPEGGWVAAPYDTDGDGSPDYADGDADGDSIPNAIELAPLVPAQPTDTDRDGLPDYRDDDSDGDGILDTHEGAQDRDGDMVANFRDDDADGDGVLDRDEAGDTQALTPPRECASEIDAATLRLGVVRMDNVPDYLDNDSDNDGLSDREEVVAGTERCNPDTDGDGQLDVAEAAYCARRMRTGCGTDATQTIPATDYYIILPNGAREQRELEFGTNIRVADVFFIADTTGSMGSILTGVSTSMNSIATRVRTLIPDTWFGVGHYEDFMAHVNTSGTGNYLPFHPLCTSVPGSSTAPGCGTTRYGGIMVTNNADDLQTAAMAIRGGGGDGYSSSVEALYQLMMGDGLYDHSAPAACATGPSRACEIPPTACTEGQFGAACFREGALPIVVHYSDTQSHWGSRNISPAGTTFNRETTNVMPTPHSTDDMLSAFRRRSARMISLNASTTRCEGTNLTAHMGSNPCFDFRVWAEGTGSVALDGRPYMFDFNTSDPESFIAATVQGIQQIATRTPMDISTSMENDPTNPGGVDARRFIGRAVPSCSVAPTNTMCWTAADGTTHSQAVARTDLTTFYRVLPGTRVRFTVYFNNEGVYPGDPENSRLFRAFIHVLSGGAARLDTREVYILVPALPAEPG